MGIHGVIEFANRLLTFLLVIVAIAAFGSVWNLRKSRRDLFWLTLMIGLGIPAQAVIGGVSVWMKLNPYVVGLHFVVSVVMVVLSTLFVLRVGESVSSPDASASRGLRLATWVVAILQLVTISLGILTTGSGPHAGDAKAPRNGLDTYTLEHLHSYPAYAAVIATAIVLAASLISQNAVVSRAAGMLMAVNALQIVIGIWQSRTGLPPILVGTHMLLACLVAAASTNLVYRARKG